MDEPELAELLGRHAALHQVPGAAAGILHDGETTVAACGTADASTGVAVTHATRFSAGSLTKTMVATVVALLAREGGLSLGDPVAEHVPELRRTRWAARATLRDLLGNRSPVPLRADLEFGFGARREDDPEALARFVAEIADAEPATGVWSYANAGWCVLGRAIEAATGTAWEDAMRRLLFDPAGMDGVVLAGEDVRTPRASGHVIVAGLPEPVPPLVSRAYGPAGTSVTATVDDLLRLAAMHLDDPALAELRTPAARVPVHGWLDGWCLGWAWFDWGGAGMWGWDGLIDGERAVVRIVPERRAAVVLLTNSETGRAMYRSFVAELMGSTLGVRVPPLRLAPVAAGGDLGRFEGAYGWPDRRVEVAAAGDRLRLRRDGVDTDARPLGGGAFLVDAGDPDAPSVTFGAFDAGGRPQVLYDMVWGLPRLDE